MKDVEDHQEFEGRNRVLAVAVGLSPVWLAAFLFLTPRSGFGGGLYQPTEAEVLAGQISLLVSFTLAGLLMLAGTVVLWRARSTRVALGAMLLLTLPALFLVILGPGFVFMLVNATT